MVRKPLLLIMAAISIVVCAGIINATLWDLGDGWFTDSIQDERLAQRSWFTHAFGYDMNGKMMADAKPQRPDVSLSVHATDPEKKNQSRTEPMTSQSKMPTLLLLANGIIGLVGFWRRVAK